MPTWLQWLSNPFTAQKLQGGVHNAFQTMTDVLREFKITNLDLIAPTYDFFLSQKLDCERTMFLFGPNLVDKAVFFV